jgi:FixJ family two-component response regulator
MVTNTTVFIVDDDKEVRDALVLLMESVGLRASSFDSAQAFLNQFDPGIPGCVITDVRMPGMSGLELQKKLNEKNLHPQIIIITGHGDIPMTVESMRQGALDFIEKPFNDQRLLDSVHRAIEIDASKRGQATRIAEIKERMETLTKREREVMNLITRGKRNKIIADELCVTQSTVEAHRSKVMEKMQAESLSDLMRMVLSLEMN